MLEGRINTHWKRVADVRQHIYFYATIASKASSMEQIQGQMERSVKKKQWRKKRRKANKVGWLMGTLWLDRQQPHIYKICFYIPIRKIKWSYSSFLIQGTVDDHKCTIITHQSESHQSAQTWPDKSGHGEIIVRSNNHQCSDIMASSQYRTKLWVIYVTAPKNLLALHSVGKMWLTKAVLQISKAHPASNNWVHLFIYPNHFFKSCAAFYRFSNNYC